VISSAPIPPSQISRRLQSPRRPMPRHDRENSDLDDARGDGLRRHRDNPLRRPRRPRPDVTDVPAQRCVADDRDGIALDRQVPHTLGVLCEPCATLRHPGVYAIEKVVRVCTGAFESNGDLSRPNSSGNVRSTTCSTTTPI